MINKAQSPYKFLRDLMGQVTLEFTLIFVVMVALLMGLLSLWKWSSDNIIRRQQAYNTTRQTAGSLTPGVPAKWTAGAAHITDNSTYFFVR